MNDFQNFKESNVKMSYKLRKIYIYDSIDEDSSLSFVNCIDKFIDYDNRIGRREPIEILINSGGGLVYYGLTIISTIEKLKKMGYKITTTNIGICASMAFVISVCGDIRKSYNNSVYMYHDISTYLVGKSQEIKEEMENLEKLKRICDNIVINNTKITQEQIDDWCMRKIDKYFYSEDVIELGIVDIVE